MLIGGFQPFSLSDFPGKSAAIVFTQGCNYRCPYCHNRRLWQMSEPETGRFPETEILDFLATRKDQLDGLVITGGEPTLQPDLPSFLDKVKKTGLSVKLDTNGSRPDILTRLIDANLLDYIAMDIKGPFPKYDLLCGLHVDTLPVRTSIEIIVESSLPHHFRTTYYTKELTGEDMTVIKQYVPPSSRHLTQECRNCAAPSP